jgi:GntR family transcriptional regulator / MocR family aminotransferase
VGEIIPEWWATSSGIRIRASAPFSCSPSWLISWSRGFARHLKKMRALYAARRGYLIDALAEVFGEALHVPARAGGIHVLAYLKSKHGDKALAEAANAQGLGIMALSQWRMRGRSPAGLLLGFANLATPAQALELVWRLGKALRSL